MLLGAGDEELELEIKLQLPIFVQFTIVSSQMYQYSIYKTR